MLKSSRFAGVARVIAFALLALVVLGIWSVCVYNKLVKGEQAVNAAFERVDAQLQERNRLLAPLAKDDALQTAEPELTAQLLEAIEQLAQADDIAGKIAADADLSIVLRRLDEELPQESERSELATETRSKLRETETDLAGARKAYNDAVAAYNRSRRGFPARIISSLLDFPKYVVFSYRPAT